MQAAREERMDMVKWESVQATGKATGNKVATVSQLLHLTSYFSREIATIFL